MIALVSVPERPDAPSPSADALRAVLDSVATRPLIAYVDDRSGTDTLEIDAPRSRTAIVYDGLVRRRC